MIFFSMDVKEVQEIFDLNKKRFNSDKELYDFLDRQIQQHTLEIYDRKTNNDPHYLKEIADLAILTKLMAMCEGVDEKVFEERYKKFKEKANSQ